MREIKKSLQLICQRFIDACNWIQRNKKSALLLWRIPTTSRWASYILVSWYNLCISVSRKISANHIYFTASKTLVYCLLQQSSTKQQKPLWCLVKKVKTGEYDAIPACWVKSDNEATYPKEPTGAAALTRLARKGRKCEDNNYKIVKIEVIKKNYGNFLSFHSEL